MEIGGYRIDALLDGEGPREPTEYFPDTTGEQWERHRWILDSEGCLTIAIGGYLVRGHGRTALVDLGYGPGSLTGIETGGLLEALRERGVEPGDVSDVLFTHLHVDHVGWASVDGVSQFPNATFRCGAGDHQHFVVERNDRFADEKLQPCRNRFETYEQSGALPCVTTLHAPGHTPGSTVIVFPEGDRRAVLLGDVVHSPVQLLEREWNTPYDLDPALARRTRIQLLEELEDEEAPPLLAAGHFPGLRFLRGLRW